MATRHDRIFTARGTLPTPANVLFERIASLQEMIGVRDLPGIVRTLEALVPTYRPSELLQRRLKVTPPA